MTGAGIGSARTTAGSTATVEIRSVNHKNLDVRVKASPALWSHAGAVEDRVRSRLRRGRIEVQVRFEGSADGVAHLDRARARDAFAELTELAEEIAPGQPVPLTLLASVPDLFSTASADPAEERRAVLDAVDAACEAVLAMRRAEGVALARDLETRRQELAEARAGAEARVAAAVAALRDRLRERVARLLEGTSVAVDPGRLEQEVVLFADRSDVSEELARLDSHLEQVRTLLARGGPEVGKRLDFLLQELNREVHTLGSKSADAVLAQRVVAMKTAIARMREQAANVA
jgi:uncharacterized protein (TIGR00255 family)